MKYLIADDIVLIGDAMDSRNRILNETERMCLEMMPNRVTVDEIVKRAKVGKGTFYRFFRDKDELFAQLTLGLIEELRALLADTAVTSTGSSLERIAALGKTFGSFMGEHPILVALTIFLRDTPPWIDTGREEGFLQIESVLFSMVESLVKMGMAQGEIRRDVEPDTVVHFILGAYSGSRSIRKRTQTLRREELEILVLNGLSPTDR